MGTGGKSRFGGEKVNAVNGIGSDRKLGQRAVQKRERVWGIEVE